MNGVGRETVDWQDIREKLFDIKPTISESRVPSVFMKLSDKRICERHTCNSTSTCAQFLSKQHGNLIAPLV